MNIQLQPQPAVDFEQEAAVAAQLLRMLGNEKRLLALCHLAGSGEMSVGALADKLGLSQSALSQHLALMREHDLVRTRRQNQTIFYQLNDPKVGTLLQTLQQLYCPALAEGESTVEIDNDA